MINKPTIRVRIAPSPTGHIHVGTARTALFNWLFAKHVGGKFILRIEDTDTERSKKEYEDEIIDGLRWLGITWDEGPDIGGEYGPYRQSERIEIYKKYLTKLLATDEAYYCICTAEELEIEHKKLEKNGEVLKYSGKCRYKKHTSGVIRFRIPEEKAIFQDIIRGEVTFDGALIGDIVIAKSLTQPLYNFAVVIDDELMGITHVIRGEEHIANTPRQIFLQRALQFRTLQYAHLPLLLDANRAKLSKRLNAVSLNEYKTAGYLPAALCNFFALLGWHPKEDKEIITLKETTELFSLDRVQKAGAIFNEEKLNWINAQYIKAMSVDALLEALQHYDKNFEALFAIEDENKIKKIIAMEKERLETLKDFKEQTAFFFAREEYAKTQLLWKKTTTEKTAENLRAVYEIIKKISSKNYEKEYIKKQLESLTEKEGRGEVLWPLRVALSGRQASPGPFEIAEILGQKETLERIAIAIEKVVP